MSQPAPGSTLESSYEIGIIGGGPAGLSAAIWSARYLHTVVLVDSGDPRNWQTRSIQGYLGLPAVRPLELRRLGREASRDQGVALYDANVLRVDPHGDGRFRFSVSGGEHVVVQRVLLAIGIRDVWPDIPGLSPVYGANAHVCPDCDGLDARDKKVVVIGHGRRAVGMALNLATWTSDIIICTNGRPPEMDNPEYCEKLDALNIPVITERVTRVCYDGDAINCLELANGMHLDADKVFFTLAQYPADDLGVELGCVRDDDGQIVVDVHGQTSVPNVYAAGDITPGPQLAIRAAADGAAAAIAMHKSLVPEERKLRPATATRATAGSTST